MAVLNSEKYNVVIDYVDGQKVYGSFLKNNSDDSIPIEFSYDNGMLKWGKNNVHFSFGRRKDESEIIHGVLFWNNKKTIVDLYLFPQAITSPIRYVDSTFQVYIEKNILYTTHNGFYYSYILPDNKLQVLSDLKPSRLKETSLDLKMDIYMPYNDTLSVRPTIVFFHGGAFLFDNKESSSIVRWCKNFAARGYNAISVDYRLGFRLNKKSMKDAEHKAIEDAVTAVNFLVDNKDAYHIDTNNIFLAGSSAGAMIALQAPYHNKCNKIRIKGIANLWGAVPDTSIFNCSKNISIISYHGGKDPIVPDGYKYPFYKYIGILSSILCEKKYGSTFINEEFRNLGLCEELFFFPTLKHKLHWDKDQNKENVNFDFIDKSLNNFFLSVMFRNKSIDMINDGEYVCNDGSIKSMHWMVTGGYIMKIDRNRIWLRWNPNSKVHKVMAVGLYSNGTPFYYTKYE